MSDINSPPEGSEPNSSPAFPHLQACIEAVVRDAVQSGIPEESVRQLLRRHEIQLGEILATLNRAYDIRPTEETTNAPTTNQPQSNLSPAVQTAANQPFIHPGELLEDEDVPPPTPTPAVSRVVHRPSALPPSPMKHLITNATNTIQQHVERGFQPLKTPAVEDRNDTSRQNPFVDSPSPPERETFLSKASAFAVDVAGLSVDAIDRGQAMDDQRRRRVRDWDDGQASSSRVMVDPTLPAAGDPSVAEPEEPESLLDELAERKKLESPEGDRLAALANNPAELRASIRSASEARAREQVDDQRNVAGSGEAGSLTGSQMEMEREQHGVEENEPQASGANEAGEQTEESEVVDPKSAEKHTTSPENADETGGDHQRSSIDDSVPGDTDDDQRSSENDAEPDGADDVSPKTTKHSPVTKAAEEQLERDNHARDEARKEKQKGKERDKEKEALRSPVRRA